MSISLKDLKQMDEISIRTQNSVYRFCVIDPAQCRGLLSGGLLGEAQHEACLSSEAAGDDTQREFSARLEIGRCASFYIYVRDRLRRLNTSEILDVSLIKIPSQAQTVC